MHTRAERGTCVHLPRQRNLTRFRPRVVKGIYARHTLWVTTRGYLRPHALAQANYVHTLKKLNECIQRVYSDGVGSAQGNVSRKDSPVVLDADAAAVDIAGVGLLLADSLHVCVCAFIYVCTSLCMCVSVRVCMRARVCIFNTHPEMSFSPRCKG